MKKRKRGVTQVGDAGVPQATRTREGVAVRAATDRLIRYRVADQIDSAAPRISGIAISIGSAKSERCRWQKAIVGRAVAGDVIRVRWFDPATCGARGAREV